MILQVKRSGGREFEFSTVFTAAVPSQFLYERQKFSFPSVGERIVYTRHARHESHTREKRA